MAKKKHGPAKVSRKSAIRTTPKASFWPDAISIAILSVIAVYFASVTWLKWPDPLIDFGREMYLPWRITQGALLYRDAGHLYGPLSPYLNSVLFRLGGVGLMTLVIANLVIYFAILVILYYLVRLGWGRWAALGSGAFFVGVFSFSHLVGVGNYNFLAPYSHEMTHGTLLILGLILALRQIVRRLDARWVAVAGCLAGLSVLMKPEIMLACGAVVAGAAFLILRRDFRNPPWSRWMGGAGIFIAAALTPVVVTTLLFWLVARVSFQDALFYTNFAWWNVVRYTRLGPDQFQLAALGLDHPWQNLAKELAWVGGAIVFACGLAWAMAAFMRTAKAKRFWTALPILIAAILVVVAAARWVPWMNMGYALPGILLCGALIEIVQMRNASAASDDGTTARVLLWMAALAMLARMALSPRIFHYGFVQAALAGVVGIAILLASIPELFRLEDSARKGYQLLLSILLVFVIGVVASNSMEIYSFQTFSVGQGADQFYAFDQNQNPTGLLIEQARQYLSEDVRKNNVRSLLVLPEGVMVNYLTRLPDPILYYFFAPFVLAEGREDEMVRGLAATPPDRILILSRDMREFGVGRFGDSPQHGQKLLEFVKQNYQSVYSFGDKDPLDPDSFGFLVLAHKN